MSRLKVVIATPFARHDGMERKLKFHHGLEVLRIRSKEELNFATLKRFSPRYIFFPHWSWRIPEIVFENFECVIFHMTDLPFGRGGSPLQNLVVRGIKDTRLTALRCVAEMDAGPIYAKRQLSLLGSAEEILLRAGELTAEIIEHIVLESPTPQPQIGTPIIFRRRLPQDSDAAGLNELNLLFDHIRMLDGDGYPLAYIETEHFRFEFSRASLKSDSIVADVNIYKKKT